MCKRLSRQTSGEGSLRQDFEHELHILSSLRCLQHPNIIRLITGFTLNNTYNFLLPKAEGDLKDLLKSIYPPREFATLTSMLASLWGLSSALESVHNFFFEDEHVHQIGCHYDIKPRNILYSEGKLMLSDFGLSRLKYEDEGSQSLFQRGEGWYLAPECEATEDDFKPGRIGRASDVWSLGCVFAEVMVYVDAPTQAGHTMVDQFYKQRKIKLGGKYNGHWFHSDIDVNPAVSKMLDDKVQASLQRPNQPNVSELANLIKSILQFDTSQRPRVEQVKRCLFHITQQATMKEIRCVITQYPDYMDLQLQIEFHRLTIWSKISGLDAAPSKQLGTSWFSMKHTDRECNMLQESLGQFLLEVQFIHGELSKEIRPPFPITYRLQKLLDELQGLLPQNGREEMLALLEEQLVQIAIDRLSELPSQSEEGIIHDIERENSMGLNAQRLASLVTMREVASALMQDDSEGRNIHISRALLETHVADVGHHLLFRFAQSQSNVLVERLVYKGAWASHVEELIERVDAIATLRNKFLTNSNFHILQCRGYYHDASKFEFGFVYDLPETTRNTVPKTLAEVFNLTASKPQQPSLTEKFKLARSLTSHILNFHRGGWVHKGISSNNIICFPDAFSSIAESLSSIYFIGFNNSRNNVINSYTEFLEHDLEYQHPLYLRSDKPYVGEDGDRSPQRFRQEFDYYSTGLVLLEIALWTPLPKITRKIDGSPEEVRQEIIRNGVRIVKAYMGDVYGESVLYCLTAYDDSNRLAKDVRDLFWQNVVLPLNACSM